MALNDFKVRAQKFDGRKYARLSDKELKKEASKLFTTVNRRYRNVLEKVGPTPATEYIRKERGLESSPTTPFSVKGKSREEVLDLMREAVDFTEAKTSNVKGAADWISKLETKSWYSDYQDLSKKEKNKLWDAIDDIRKSDKALWDVLKNQIGSDELIDQAVRIRKGGRKNMSSKSTANRLKEALDNMYENLNTNMSIVNDDSAFMDLPFD